MSIHKEPHGVVRVLITGAGSYVGNAVQKHLQQYPEQFQVDMLSMRGSAWQSVDLSPYDCIFHTVGIAHVDTQGADEKTIREYYRVNCDLAVELAKKAQEQGVSQFIYMSSIIVYGESVWGKNATPITAQTPPSPVNFYGKSKLQAEIQLQETANDYAQRNPGSAKMHIALVRSPFVYGHGCKGNYQMLARIAAKTNIFPNYKNQRSMIYIENLAEFIKILIQKGIGGTFYPQNAQTVSTSDMIAAIAATDGRKISLCRILNPLISLCAHIPGKPRRMVRKAFGNQSYDPAISVAQIDGYQIYSLEESLARMHQNALNTCNQK
ncbi:MAG: NAD-dependent epimerase/dehydratase family protein [Clostridium sp.]|jgi:UDP-glucose 4-epimerase|nr:NAD-dependent epimerase/dehydratase family protein [Clostridium sp.]